MLKDFAAAKLALRRMSFSAIPQPASAAPTNRWRKRLLQVAVPLALLYGATLGGFYYAMCQPPEEFGQLMSHVGPVPFLLFPFESMWKHARGGRLQVGDAAPDFTLPLIDKSTSVTLSSFRGKQPVVLVFGSYT